MVFSSPIFLLAFLPLFLAVYFILPTKIRNVWLLLASLFFYSWGEGRLVALLLFSTLVDYYVALLIAHNGLRGITKQQIDPLEPGDRSARQKLFLAISILVNVSVLAVFKYADFGLGNYAAIASLFEWQTEAPLSLGIALPLGISFYTFQSMSYTIDVYRGAATATRNIIRFATYVTMFPQLVAGPIVRYVDVARELVTRVVSRQRFTSGVERFIIGLAKKVLIANVVSVPVDTIFALPAESLSAPVAWFGVVGYALQIYFDFSGYSDMAIGLGRMFGFTFLENFNFPYISQSLREFWRRWHISLSTWFRDYVYIPLGGNKKGRARTYMNLIIVFFVTGLWHGASWSFVVWGLFHGFFLILERFHKGAWLKRLPRALRYVYVVIVVLFSWVLFRADTLLDALSYMRSMFGLGASSSAPIGVYLTTTVILAFIIGIVASAPISQWIARCRGKIAESGKRIVFAMLEFGQLAYVAGLFLFVLLQLASGTNNPFIYFRF